MIKAKNWWWKLEFAMSKRKILHQKYAVVMVPLYYDRLNNHCFYAWLCYGWCSIFPFFVRSLREWYRLDAQIVRARLKELMLQANVIVVSLVQNALRDIQLHLSLVDRLFLMREIYIVWKSNNTLRKVHKQSIRFLYLEQLPLLPRFLPPQQIWSFLPLAPSFLLVPAPY